MAQQVIREIRIAPQHPEWRLLGRRPESDVPVNIFQKVAARFPECMSFGMLVCRRALGDPLLGEILEFAGGTGVLLPKHSGDPCAQAVIRDYPQGFGLEEIQQFSQMECRTESFILGKLEVLYERSGITDMLIHPDAKLRRNAKRIIGSVPNLYHLIAVRNNAVEALLSAGLSGLKLVPINCKGGWPTDIPPLSLIWSDCFLPPVSQSLYDNAGNVFRSEERDYTKIISECYLIDGYSVKPSLIYDKNPMGDLDVALSHERTGGKAECYHRIVYSRRAREVLTALGLKFEVCPVRVNGCNSGTLGSMGNGVVISE